MGVLPWGFVEGSRYPLVVDDEVSWACVLFDVFVFAGAGWARHQDDSGSGGAPFFFVAVVGSAVVAGGAGGSEVAWFPPLAAVCDGGDVVDLCGVGGAAGPVDLAEVLVSFEDGSSDALPGAGVLGFGHGFDELSDSSRFLVGLWGLPACFSVSLLAVLALPALVAEAGFVASAVGEVVAGGVDGAAASLAFVVGVFGALLGEVVESVGEVVELFDGAGGFGEEGVELLALEGGGEGGVADAASCGAGVVVAGGVAVGEVVGDPSAPGGVALGEGFKGAEGGLELVVGVGHGLVPCLWITSRGGREGRESCRSCRSCHRGWGAGRVLYL